MDHTKTPLEGGTQPKSPEATPRPWFRRWTLALPVAGFTILLLLGVGMFSGRDFAGGELFSSGSLLILLVLLPCVLMLLMMLPRRGDNAAERDQKDDTGR